MNRKTPLTVEQILAWADAHHKRTGRWPTQHSGPIRGTKGENWHAVSAAMRIGCRGMPGGTTLRQLLVKCRGMSATCVRPAHTMPQILAWVDHHHKLTGRWPDSNSGPVVGTQGETWRAIDRALQAGLRGLPGGSSLQKLLARERGVTRTLTVKQVLAWAEAHRRQTGQWPTVVSGTVAGHDGLIWRTIDAGLRRGYRGLPSGSSLSQLLGKSPRIQSPKKTTPLTVAQILVWAKRHRRLTGRWPTKNSGPVPGTSEKWGTIAAHLRKGGRGLPGGSSLAQVLLAVRDSP
jgi:hypothetical protein